MHLLPSLNGSHQSGMIPINTGITCTYYISTLSNLTSMGTALGYIVTQDLYIVWGLARGTLENSLWFSLASIEPSDSYHKVALTVCMLVGVVSGVGICCKLVVHIECLWWGLGLYVGWLHLENWEPWASRGCANGEPLECVCDVSCECVT
jgi:hypothetical protein